MRRKGVDGERKTGWRRRGSVMKERESKDQLGRLDAENSSESKMENRKGEVKEGIKRESKQRE